MSRVVAALKKIVLHRATVSTATGDWVSVWDEMSDVNPSEAERVARELSAAVQAPVVEIRVDDVLSCSVHDHGERLDRYVSLPDYEYEVSQAERDEVAGRPDVLARFARPGATPDAIATILRDTGVDFEEQRASRLAEALGIAPDRALLTFAHFGADNGPDLVGGTKGFRTVEGKLGARAKELFEAIAAGNATSVAALLDESVPANAIDKYGCTALQRAVEGGTVEIVRLLLRRAVPRSDVQAALSWSIVRGFLDITATLVESGADVNEVDEHGRTPLFVAVYGPHANPELLRWLIAAGADPRARMDWRGIGNTNRAITALHGAVENGDLDTIRFLVEAGADPHARNAQGLTPLLLAARARKPDVVRYLLSVGDIGDARMADGTSSIPWLSKWREFFRTHTKAAAALDEIDRMIDLLQKAGV